MLILNLDHDNQVLFMIQILDHHIELAIMIQNFDQHNAKFMVRFEEHG